MSVSSERLQVARTVVLDVLTGRSTPESDPMRFEDDAVLFSVRIVERADSAWLLAQLADPGNPLAGRVEVLHNLGDTFDEALMILRREDPGLARPESP